MSDPPFDLPAHVTALLQSMVRINSINAALPGSPGGEHKLTSLLEKVALGFGLKTRRLALPGGADQLLVTCENGADRPWLLFDSHLDTVAVQGMTIDPFGGELRDGKVWGRGSCDTKGTGAAMLWALRDYAAENDGPNNIALLFSVDEEVAMTGIQYFVNHDLPTLAWRPAAAVIGEPTEHRPVIAHNGCGRWVVRTRGVACHSSVPHEGRSAISAMVRVIDAIESSYIPGLDATHPLTGSAVCSVNTVRGGDAPNIVPAGCEAQIDRRFVPGEDHEQGLKALDAVLRPLRDGELEVDYELEAEVGHPPFGTDHNGAWTDTVRGMLSELGLPTAVHGAPFATHACYFDQAGIPAVVLGPGSPHKAHTKDEWVAVDEIERGVAVYGRLMRATLDR